ncbi:hypothetical protein N483_07445 [Pseudoalteromonas luteoviolacea NCIMB 1944]|nr:hypothetical protein N483_07445 [Pseudoalteromonas luteoviolacea NCIMB 1944]
MMDNTTIMAKFVARKSNTRFIVTSLKVYLPTCFTLIGKNSSYFQYGDLAEIFKAEYGAEVLQDVVV